MLSSSHKVSPLPKGRVRFLALKLLTRVEAGAYAARLLDGTLTRGRLSPSDSALLTELVYGVLRFRGYLDYIITPFLDKPLRRLHPTARNALRLGLYQLTHLNTPAYAALDETVQAVRETAPRGAGVVNAVLRRLVGEWNMIEWPNASTDPAGYISAFHSHPRWLVEMWMEELGEEATRELCAANNQEASLTIRANRTKVDAEELMKLLADEGIRVGPVKGLPFALTISASAGRLCASELYKQGYFYIQDSSAMLAAMLLAGETDSVLFEPCAGLGGKATQLAELSPDAAVVAGDRNLTKLGMLLENCCRLGIANIFPVCADGLASPILHSDKVLLDVPCSNLGVLRRHPEARWRLKAEDIDQLAKLQLELLQQAAGVLPSGGECVYSTCTICKRENWGVVENFLSENDDFSLVEPQRRVAELFELYPQLPWEEGITIFPGMLGGDGTYLCLLRHE